MSRMIKLTAVFLVAVFLAGCACPFGVQPSSPSSPGQAVASENNYENGVKQYEKGHYTQAIHEFEKAVEKDPTNYKAYYYLGMSHHGEGAVNTALSYLKQALGLSSSDASWAAKIQAQINAMTQEQEQTNQGKAKGKNK